MHGVVFKKRGRVMFFFFSFFFDIGFLWGWSSW